MTNLLGAIGQGLAVTLLRPDHRFVSSVVHSVHASVTAYDSAADNSLFNAVVAAEDVRFERHSGLDFRAMCRALWFTLFRGHLQGASTVEQQLVRVIRHRYELTLNRKVSEVILALALSKQFEKATIMEVYLELAYFGWRGNGIRQICDRLGLQPNSLRLEDAALLAALIKLPMPKVKSEPYQTRLSRRVRHIRNMLGSK
ncbi:MULTISPECIES: biosynthetic peptidoglycan transglycosylase [unclassified Mesorhizobium]|uniref:biosynthetic peptidoglycan transglycosylase n=1 Tax=unclassified Mesorhizobium TaxID=325217 RepID=UPI0016738FD7|nr:MULTISPECIES: biosynthetic peptidoglycan transglycosylase [unclassified Mesorhizobium]